MVRSGGTVLAAMGILHMLVGVLLFSNELLSIWDFGLLRGLRWGYSELAAFWFLIFGWLMVTTGLLLRATADHEPAWRASRWVAISLVVVPVLTGLILPVSGLWLLLIPGVLVLNELRHPSRGS